MRAVSSPSLTETPTENPPSTSLNFSAKPEPNGSIQNHNELNERGNQQSGKTEFQLRIIKFSKLLDAFHSIIWQRLTKVQEDIFQERKIQLAKR